VKEFVTADDIRALAEQGERELMVREHTTLTDAALDAARMHGVRLVEGGATSQSQPAASVGNNEIVLFRGDGGTKPVMKRKDFGYTYR